MSQHEPSYYEIALTNRQVLTVFVVLLVCVVAAFFSGVWIGRRGAGPQAPELVAEVAPPDEAGEAGGEPVKELRFFSDEPRRRPPSPDTTLREDLGAGAGKPPIESPAAGAEGAEKTAAPGGQAPATAPGPDPPAGSPPPEKVAAKPPPTPQPDKVAAKRPSASEPEKVAAKPPAAPTPGAPGSGGDPAASGSAESTGDLVIQVFFSSDEEKARALVERLGGSGYPAFLSPVRVGVQTMYRVRVGPYRERAEAEAIASKVQRAFKLDTWITQ